MAKEKNTEKEEVVDSVTVTWQGGVREYTKAVHGDDFMELAKEFATKKRGTVA